MHQTWAVSTPGSSIQRAKGVGSSELNAVTGIRINFMLLNPVSWTYPTYQSPIRNVTVPVIRIMSSLLAETPTTTKLPFQRCIKLLPSPQRCIPRNNTRRPQVTPIYKASPAIKHKAKQKKKQTNKDKKGKSESLTHNAEEKSCNIEMNSNENTQSK